MNGNGELAKNNIRNIYKCAYGVVHIKCRGASLYYSDFWKRGNRRYT